MNSITHRIWKIFAWKWIRKLSKYKIKQVETQRERKEICACDLNEKYLMENNGKCISLEC